MYICLYVCESFWHLVSKLLCYRSLKRATCTSSVVLLGVHYPALTRLVNPYRPALVTNAGRKV